MTFTGGAEASSTVQRMKKRTPGHVKRARASKRKRLKGVPFKNLHWLTIDGKPVAGFKNLKDAKKQKDDLPSKTRNTKRVRIEKW